MTPPAQTPEQVRAVTLAWVCGVMALVLGLGRGVTGVSHYVQEGTRIGFAAPMLLFGNSDLLGWGLAVVGGVLCLRGSRRESRLLPLGLVLIATGGWWVVLSQVVDHIYAMVEFAERFRDVGIGAFGLQTLTWLVSALLDGVLVATLASYVVLRYRRTFREMAAAR